MKSTKTPSAEENQYAKILDLLKVRPAVYEVCEWRINEFTGKPEKICYIKEPVNAVMLG